jgi:predicted secreted protein
MLEDIGGGDASRRGASNTHRWRFRWMSAGSGRIEVRYERLWERSGAPAKIFTLKVSVRP